MQSCYCVVVMWCVDGDQARVTYNKLGGDGQLGCVGPLSLLAAGCNKGSQVAVCVNKCEEGGLIGRNQAMPALALWCIQGAVVGHVGGVLDALLVMSAEACLTGLRRPLPPARLLCQRMGAGA